jgi:alpha-1,2-mannosyltransferase
VRAKPRATVLIAVAIGVLAFVARLLPVLRGGGLTGVLGYDDGVYFGAAEAFVFGRLPYRDFLLLHPPGVLVVLAPFAELARLTTDVRGMAAARLAFMAVGALNAVLVWHVARRRLGVAAGVVAGLFYALWGPAAYAERTTMLEPLVNLGVLSSLVLLGDLTVVTRRRLLLAGAALGAATAVKLWAGVPLVVLALWLLARGGPRRSGLYVAGAAATATVVCAPFFLAAPSRMFQLIVLDQIGRTNNGVTTLQRLVGITDAPAATGSLTLATDVVAPLLAACVVGASVVVAWRLPVTRPWVTLLAAQTALLLTSPSYFSHYPTYVAPALALVAGASAGLAFGWYRGPVPELRAVAVAATALMLLVIGANSEMHRDGRNNPGVAVQAALAGARCVTADTPAVLIATDELSVDLRHGCPLLLDVTGLTYNQDRGDLAQGSTGHARRSDIEWQRQVERYFAHSDATVLQTGNPDRLDAATIAEVAARRNTLHDKGYDVLVRSPAVALRASP